MSNTDGVLRILQTATSRDKLNAALDVIEEFKALESDAEWLVIMFDAWAKLEQLEDCLRLLTGRDAESVSDEIMRKAFAALSPPSDSGPGER